MGEIEGSVELIRNDALDVGQVKDLKVKIPTELYTKLRSLKLLRGKSMSEALEEAIRMALTDVSNVPVFVSTRTGTEVVRSHFANIAPSDQRPKEKEIKVRVPVSYHIRLHSMKVMTGRQISSFVSGALMLYFASEKHGF